MIKRTILALLFLCNSAFCIAQSVHFEPNLELAFQKAKQENKPVFIEYYNENCSVCKTLEPFFKNKEVSEFYNKNFINYKLNTENIKNEDRLFMDNTKLKPESVPSFFFFDSDKNFIHHSGTKPDSEYLIKIGKTALNPEQRSGSLSTKYNSGDRSVRTLYAYSNLMQLYRKDSLVNKIADDLFEAFPKQNLGSQTSYIIIKNSVFTIENGFFDYWINHIDDLKGFEKGKKAGNEIKVLENILFRSINSEEKKKWDLKKIRSVKEMILKTGLSDNPDTFFWQQESALLIKDKQEKEALELFHKIMKNEGENTTSALYITNYYLNLLNSKSNLSPIKTWIDILYQRNNSVIEKADLLYTNLLYHKIRKDKKEVKKLEKEAKEFYKNNSIDLSKLNILLKS